MLIQRLGRVSLPFYRGERMLENLRILAGVLLGALGAFLVVWLVSGDGGRKWVRPQAAPLLSSGETVVGEAITYPTGAPAKVTAQVMTLAPGQETGWHTHGVPVLGYVLEGELEVDYGPKGVKAFHAGDAVLEAISTPHNGRNVGSAPLKILAVFMGAEGLQNTAPARR